MDPNKSNSFLSISSDEENSSNKIDNNNLNEKSNLPKDNINNNSLENKKEKEKENNDKEYILKLRNKLNSNITKLKNRKMLVLPPPENELADKHYKENNLQNEDRENNGYIKLMNPDNISLNIKESDSNNKINNEKNIISINQKDILDKNWEIKYINKILNKDMKEAFKNEEAKDKKNDKLNNKKRKRDKNKDDDELSEENIRSKYDKISTKKRYGW